MVIGAYQYCEILVGFFAEAIVAPNAFVNSATSPATTALFIFVRRMDVLSVALMLTFTAVPKDTNLFVNVGATEGLEVSPELVWKKYS
jgi:hypothetical protein